MTDTSN